jgi:peptide/nickel transport system substrate-binding protein
MHKPRRVLGVLGSLVVFSAACGGSDDTQRAAASTATFCEDVLPRVAEWVERQRVENPVSDDPRYGGSVVVGSIGEIADGMNAFAAADYFAVQHQDYVSLMTLLRYDEQLVPQPYLATSWEVAPDGSSITFHLRDDVWWHDGVRTTARDVAFTYRTVTDPRTAFPNASYWDHYEAGVGGVEVVDDFTVRIRMTPHPDFLDPWRSVAIMPEHLLGEVAPDELAAHPYGSVCPVGNGPFVFDEHVPQDRWVFTANPGFPQALGGRPFVDRYVYRVVPEQTTLLAELLTGGIDVDVATTARQAQVILEAENVELLRYPFRNTTFVAWNGRRPKLSDARVRRALTLGINRSEIVMAVLEGYGTVANSLVPPFHWAYNDSEDATLPYDPEGARRLLEEAGWRDRDGDGVRENAEGEPLSISVKYNSGSRTRQSVAEIMQAQLAPIGVQITPEVVEWATLLDQITTPEVRDFDGVAMGWLTDFKVDNTDLFHSTRADQPFAFAGTNNPEIDRLLEALALTVDPAEALPVWAEYQRALIQEQPYTFFFFPDHLDGVNTRMQGVEMDARGEWINVKDWWIDPAAR